MLCKCEVMVCITLQERGIKLMKVAKKTVQDMVKGCLATAFPADKTWNMMHSLVVKHATSLGPANMLRTKYCANGRRILCPASSAWSQLVMSCKALTQGLHSFLYMAAKRQQGIMLDSKRALRPQLLETQVSDEEAAIARAVSQVRNYVCFAQLCCCNWRLRLWTCSCRFIW